MVVEGRISPLPFPSQVAAMVSLGSSSGGLLFEPGPILGLFLLAYATTVAWTLLLLRHYAG